MFKQIAVGAAAFGTAVYGGYTIGTASRKRPPADSSLATGDGAGGGDAKQQPSCGCCAFDRLADVYDDIVGPEETGMLFGVLRWWLLRGAHGDVLELSAGTGRNLPHLPYDQIHSLTLTDVSTSMLQQAQRKYFDDLQLQYKQPNMSCKFVLADAEHLVAAPGQPPHMVLLQPYTSSRKQPTSKATSSSGSSPSKEPSGGLFRFKQPSSSGGNATTSTSSSSSNGRSSDRSSNSSSSSDSSSGGTGGSAEVVSNPARDTTTTPSSSSSSNNNEAASTSSSSVSQGGWRWSRNKHKAGQDSGGAAAAAAAADQPASSSTFAPHSFDVVVDSFGLCSCDNPVLVLQQAAELVKPGGKLLLLEHGRGSYAWINRYMDAGADSHHKTYGCWYNRDILGIVSDAGLEVEWSFRWHFGTSYLIVAAPPAAKQQQPAGSAVAAGAA